MKIRSFSDYKITTVTMVITLTHPVDIQKAFHLLPIYPVQIDNPKEVYSKFPNIQVPGAIFSIRHEKWGTRGLIKNKKPFRNVVTVDISTEVKNISAKLTKDSIQMCGASSKEDGESAAQHIINHLLEIQKYLDELSENQERAAEIFNWLKNVTRGQKITREITDGNTFEDLDIVSEVEDYTINSNISGNTPMISYLLSLKEDFAYHSDYVNKLDFIYTLRTLVSRNLSIGSSDISMLNYNYSLGFDVNRSALDKAFKENPEGFYSNFNNALAPQVSIQLPYEPKINIDQYTIIKQIKEGDQAQFDLINAIRERKQKRKKKKVPHHTFLVYKSGSVTQSGPGGEIMEEAYYKFMNKIADIATQIKYVEVKC